VTHLAGYAPQLFSGAGLQSKLSFGNIRVYCSIVPCSIKNRCNRKCTDKFGKFIFTTRVTSEDPRLALLTDLVDHLIGITRLLL